MNILFLKRYIDSAACQQAMASMISEDSVDWAYRLSEENYMTGVNLAMAAGITNSAVKGCKTLAEIIANPTALNILVNNKKAMNIIAASETAMNVVVASSTAMNALITSNIATKAVAASSMAMNAIAASSVARTAIGSTGLAYDTIKVSSMAIGKYVIGCAGLDPTGYDDMNAVIVSSVAMNAVAANSAAMNAVAASSTAMAALLASTIAWNIVVASSIAMTAVAASSVAMIAVAALSVAMTAVAASKMAMTAIASSNTARAAVEKSAAAIAAINALSRQQKYTGTAASGTLQSGYCWVEKVRGGNRPDSSAWLSVMWSGMFSGGINASSSEVAANRFAQNLAWSADSTLNPVQGNQPYAVVRTW